MQVWCFPLCAAATPPVHHHGGVRAPLPVSPVSDSVVVLFMAGFFPRLLVGADSHLIRIWPFYSCSDSVLILDAIGRMLLRIFLPLVSVTVSSYTP